MRRINRGGNMFIGERHRFLNLCEGLSPKVRRVFLAGKITLPEARDISARSRLENKGLHAHVAQIHNKRHDVLIRKHADLGANHDSLESLADELEAMPEHIALAVIEGHLTPLQARFAARNKFGSKAVRELSRANAPTEPYRVRKHSLKSEGSLRAPRVRVRPHFPMKR